MDGPDLTAEPLQRKHRRRIAHVPEGDMRLNRQQTHRELPGDLDRNAHRILSCAGPRSRRCAAINGSPGVRTWVGRPHRSPPPARLDADPRGFRGRWTIGLCLIAPFAGTGRSKCRSRLGRRDIGAVNCAPYRPAPAPRSTASSPAVSRRPAQWGARPGARAWL